MEQGKNELMNIDSINNLLIKVYYEKEVLRRQPKRFNVFEIVRVEHYENTHSAILAGILSSNVDNYAPLRKFLEICNIDLGKEEFIPPKVSISTETTIQVGNESRRLDILVRIGQKLCLVIENKINTSDHSNQLEAYSDWLKRQSCANTKLIYLTLNGDESADGCPKEKYVPLSYRQNIRDFLSFCSALTNVDLRFNATILQYNEFWEQWFMQENERTARVQEQILASKENFEAAKEVYEVFATAKYVLISNLLMEWQESKEKEGYSILDKASEISGKKWEDWTFKWNDRYRFGFDFNDPYCRKMTYGVADDHEEQNRITIDDWKNSSWWPAWKDILQDNAVRDIGDNASLCFSDKKRIFEVLDAAFEEMLTLLNAHPEIFGVRS